MISSIYSYLVSVITVVRFADILDEYLEYLVSAFIHLYIFMYTYNLYVYIMHTIYKWNI